MRAHRQSRILFRLTLVVHILVEVNTIVVKRLVVHAQQSSSGKLANTHDYHQIFAISFIVITAVPVVLTSRRILIFFSTAPIHFLCGKSIRRGTPIRLAFSVS